MEENDHEISDNSIQKKASKRPKKDTKQSQNSFPEIPCKCSVDTIDFNYFILDFCPEPNNIHVYQNGLSFKGMLPNRLKASIPKRTVELSAIYNNFIVNQEKVAKMNVIILCSSLLSKDTAAQAWIHVPTSDRATKSTAKLSLQIFWLDPSLLQSKENYNR